MDNMHHDQSGKLPKGLTESNQAKYPVGTTVKIITGYMSDMENAQGEVVGVFDTTVYAVSYNDKDTGEKIEDHEWVIEEEVSHKGSRNIGDTIIINASHMCGMNGAGGEIDRIIDEPVYMVDYESTKSGRWVKNHKWVIESEIETWEG